MGAFFLYKKNTHVNRPKVLEVFYHKGLINFREFDLGFYNLILFQKILIPGCNYFSSERTSLFSIGTLIYRSSTYEGSIKNLLSDFEKNVICFDDLTGNYFVLIKSERNLFFLTDPAGIQDIYYTPDSTRISSSFLAIVHSLSLVTINKQALSEVLVTGNLIRPDSLVNEILTFTVQNPPVFENLDFIRPREPDSYISSERNKNGASGQISVLQSYFARVKPFCENYGLSLGLTGGLDSRLLLILLRQAVSNLQVYSTYKKKDTEELSIAREICIKAGIDLISPEVKYPDEMDYKSLRKLLEDNFYFYDGQIRSHHYLLEEINSCDYRRRLLGGKRISVNGIGGEQYRNQERIVFNNRDFKKWIKYDLIYKRAGDIFLEKSAESEMINAIGKKICSILCINPAETISKYEIKRYFNEIYNPANRTLRTNIENQLAYFLSPFTDYRVSSNAYRIINELGLSKSFEIRMIRKLDNELTGIRTDYGFSIDRGEPYFSRLLTLGKEFTPAAVFYNMYNKRKQNSNFTKQLVENDSFFKECYENISTLNLGINLGRLVQNEFLGQLLLNTGYLIRVLKNNLLY